MFLATSRPLSGPGEPCLILAQGLGLPPPLWRQLCHEAVEARRHPLDLALARGNITEPALLSMLARLTGSPVLQELPPPAGTVFPDEAFHRRGYQCRYQGKTARLIAPTGALAEMLVRRALAGNLPPLVLTGEQDLLDALLRQHGPAIARQAATGLPDELSARTLRTGPRLLALGAGLFVLLALLALTGAVPAAPVEIVLAALTPAYLIAALAVLTAALMPAAEAKAGLASSEPALPESALPGYTLLVPLYREGNVARKLVRNLAALDYPPERRQVLLLIEADDAETLAALAGFALPPGFLLFRIPPGEPRTKPRALNAALPFATGELVTVYDAEDVPERDQLRKAAAVFARAPPELACLQARLAISNPEDGFLCQRFALDYAALFDCTRRGFSLAGWPVALGGTSNHFRAEQLRRVGGWDAANVTEDADLGYRLAEAGLAVGDLASTTWEEAPNRWPFWRNQRIRWLKGWFQTALVHAGRLPQYRQKLDGLSLLVGACIPFALLTTSLFLPVFLGLVLGRMLSPVPLGGHGPRQALLDANMLLLITIAVLTEAVPALVALHRRQWLRRWPWLLAFPVTQLMVSFCAWLALAELVTRPQHWRKTPHGLARTGFPPQPPAQKQSAQAAATISAKTAPPYRAHSPPAMSRNRPITAKGSARPSQADVASS
ncbi:glycosyltransferase [Rhabdaerophilum sp. SD176]|uniref:glycosyltransferase n=1 Tax=Rhabdaerophilum sp. SD176 TaxID=2983548 RepID=UPI0024DFEF3E|nr:glycosyltransferase [Rhabdaerophilum sp. SD176]